MRRPIILDLWPYSAVYAPTWTCIWANDSKALLRRRGKNPALLRKVVLCACQTSKAVYGWYFAVFGFLGQKDVELHVAGEYLGVMAILDYLAVKALVD